MKRNGESPKSEERKILYVATDVVVPAKKGSSTHTTEVASGLSKLGNKVSVLSRRRAEQKKFEEIDGVEFYRIYRGIFFPIESDGKGGKDPKSWLKKKIGKFSSTIYHLYLKYIHAPFCAYQAIRMDREKNFDAILERGSSLGAGAIAATLRGKPLISELIDRNHSKISLARANRVLAYRQDIPRTRVPPDILVKVPAGANIELFSPKCEQENSYQVGYAGSFRQWHGIETILKAAKIVTGNHEEAKFILVGPKSKEAGRLFRELDLEDNVVFTGGLPYNKIPYVLSDCGILLAPFNPHKDPYMEKHGFIFSPLKIFEYMALQKAIVASDVDTVTDVITHERTGLLVPPGNPQALANAIITLFEDHAQSKRLSKLARQVIKKNYSWNAFCSKLDSIIDKCYFQIEPGIIRQTPDRGRSGG